jgi:uncharacterized membrane-anchored protein YitT (DUF2179 family)
MNPIWTQIIIQTAVQGKKKSPENNRDFSNYEMAKEFLKLKVTLIHWLKDLFLMALGIGLAAFGLKSFLLPNKFIDGGVTGISLLVSEMTGLSLSVLIMLINIPFVFLAFKVINKQFAIKTAISISGLAICLATVHFPEITHDSLLVAAFGGFFLGAGIGLSIRGGSVLDGTEVLAIFLSRKLRTRVGDFILLFNVVIFSVAAYLLSVEAALYSIITYLAATKTLDFVIEGIEEYTGVTIISPRSNEITEMIIHELGRGVTVYKGKGGYGKRGIVREIDIVYTVITRLELSKLNAEIDRIDKEAFIVTSSVKDTKGGMIKKRRLKQ